ncbi:MAG: AarF/ABC1/UbiB kinase family protein [Cytophagales bacterium]|nr:AarF/ABC1/UbiB kinase family protein [Cytophagales bacterium]
MISIQTFKNIKRIRKIIQVLLKYGFEDVVINTALRKLVPKKRRQQWKRQDKLVFEYTRWERIRMVFEELGATFIKLAQILSNRPDMLPEPLIREFEKLQDKVPPFAFSEVKAIIEKETGKNINDLFERFDEKPLGSASIGQVHRAKLKGGFESTNDEARSTNDEFRTSSFVLRTSGEVAVKVQRPGVKELINTDISILKEIVRRGKNYFEKNGITNLDDIIDTFEKNLQKELDYNNEARNVEQFRNYYKDNDTFYVPKATKELSTDKVLVTEFADGCKITDIDQLKAWGLDPVKIAENGMNIYLTQIFEHGFFHADPHPGNIIIRKDGVICLIDFGMAGKLIKRDKYAFAGIFISMAQQNAKQMANNFQRLAIEHEITNRKVFENDMNEIIEDFSLLDVSESSMAELILRLQKIIYDYKMKVPGGIFLLLRALTILEGIGKSVHPDMNIYEFIKPYGAKLLQEQYSVENISDEIIDRISQFDYFFRSFPYEMSEILKKVRKGKLNFEVQYKGYEPLLKKIDSVTNRFILTFIITALVLASSIIMTADLAPEVTTPYGLPYLSIIGFSLSAFLGLILFISMWRSGSG